MKTLLAAILKILVLLALFIVGTLVAGFFLVIFLIGGWPLTILLVIVAVQKIYFPPEVRRNIAARFNQPCRCCVEPRFKSMNRQELTMTSTKGHLNGRDENAPRLLN